MIYLYTDKFILGTQIESQWDQNLRQTFEKFCLRGDIEFEMCFTDQEPLGNRVFKSNDVIFLSLHSDLTSNPLCWSSDKIKSLRFSNPGVVIHVLFADMELVSQQTFACSIYEYVDFIHYTGQYFPITQKIFNKLKYHQPLIGFDPDQHRSSCCAITREVGYTGRLRKDRLNLLDFLNKHGISKIRANGGERESNLSFDEYLDNLSSCSYNLSFSRVGLAHVVNLRPFEVFFIGGNFIELYSVETLRFFRPGIDYTVFYNKKHLAKILRNRAYVNFKKDAFESDDCDERLIVWSSASFWSDCFGGRSVNVFSIREAIGHLAWQVRFIYFLAFFQQYVVFFGNYLKYFVKFCMNRG